MKTITEHIREHIMQSRGIVERHPIPDLKALRQTEWSTRFESLMRNRLVLGAFRYGLLHAHKPQWDRVECARRKLAIYEQTGNTEMLVDVANMMLLEFEEGNHPKKHFAAQDDLEHTQVKTCGRIK